MGEENPESGAIMNPETQAVNHNPWKKNEEDPLICIVHCKHRGNAKARVTQVTCVICAHVFHAECLDITKEPNVWTCHQCRKISETVSKLSTQLELLLNQNDKLTEIVLENQRLIRSLNTECSNTTSTMITLVAEVDELKNLKENIQEVATSVGKLSCSVENVDEFESEDEEEEDATPHGTLLIGDSLLRSMKSKSEELEVTCHSGAKLTDVIKCLKKLNPKRQKYANLYLVCGTNDTTTKKGADKICDDFKSVLQVAKEKSENVHLCSILPRADEKADLGKIDNLNRLLMTTATETQVQFIDNDKNFRFQDGTVDELTLTVTDKLHLSAVGCQRLLQNMRLQDKIEVTLGEGPRSLWKTKQDTRHHPAPTSWNEPLPVPPTPRAPVMPNHNVRDSAQLVIHPQPIKFRGPSSTFSNFYCSPLNKWGIQFRSSEHAYNYRKAIEMGQHVTAESIRNAPTPRQSQIIADDITTDDRWKEMKQSVMYDLLKDKSQQCQAFREDLLASRGRSLVEDTSHEFWGRGQSGTGLNMLGRLLMTLRDNLPPNKSQTSLPHYRQPRQNYPRQTYPRQSFPRYNDSQPRCFNCGEKSHNVKTCRHPAPIQCYACFENGHKQKFCKSSNQH